jgi:hypothetical protein
MNTLELGHEQQAIQPDRRLIAGRYRLRAQIGRGRLGDIYEAEDDGYRELGVGGRVAIQLLPDRIALDHGLFSKLKLGYTVLRASPHPHVVSYFDCDHDGKFGYLIMELLDGASLRLVLDDATTLPLEEAFPVVRAIGDALQFLHAKSMVHGQLTAENVFITEDLDVRLLDVVPLDSASTVLRGVASRDPLNRADAGDDIYALACLTYEILSGRHPFNFHSPAEASLAGIKPARIPALSQEQWSALSRALSFDRDERPATVSDFFAGLGITGTERLRSSQSSAADNAAAQRRTQNAAPPARQPDTSAGSSAAPAQAAPAVVTAPAPRDEKRRRMARARRNRASRVRSFFLAIILGALVAWYFYGQPGDDIARLPALVDDFLDPAPVEEGRAEPVTVADQEKSVSSDPVVAATSLDSTVEPVAQAEADLASEHATQTNAEPTSQPVSDVATPDAAAADTGPTVPQTESAVKGQAAADTPGNTLVQSFVTVYERDGAARIAFRRPVNTTGTLYWWTGDHDAVADSDYIALEQPTVAFISGEEAETLHIPLINDSLPEARETFYVFLGQRDIETRRLEPIARVRVDVNDDD